MVDLIVSSDRNVPLLKLKYHQIEAIKYLKTLNKQKEEVYSCQGKIVEKTEIIQGETQRDGRFILATNVLDTEELPAKKMLSEYKAQQSCERGFRFFKDPLFLEENYKQEENK